VKCTKKLYPPAVIGEKVILSFIFIRQMALGEVIPHLTVENKKAELTPGLAHDRAATWRLTVNFDFSTAILTV